MPRSPSAPCWVRAFPEHGIIGEEWDPKASTGAFDWIVDPIDGTRAFISGVPVWGTLIGLLAPRPGGRRPDGAAVHRRDLSSACLETAFYTRHGERSAAPHVRQSPSSAAPRPPPPRPTSSSRPAPRPRSPACAPPCCRLRWGLDCYGYCLLAAGHIDLVVESALKNVDIAPLIPIIENAGGVVTTWDGGPAEAGGNCVAAATAELHEAAMTLLRG